MKILPLVLFFSFLQIAVAQIDAPPLEPPYTNNEVNFDGSENLIDLNQSDRSALAPAETPQITKKSVQAEMKPEIKIEAKPDTKPAVDYIQHPNAKKGLYLIDSKNNYHYKTRLLTEQKSTFNLKFASVPIPRISYQLSSGETFNFADMYGNQNLIQINLDYEWRIFKSMKQLSALLGVGFTTAKGTGYFRGKTLSANDTNGPHESYTFYALPLSLGLTYRLEYSQRPWVAPYVSAGATYYALAELRDDNKRSRFVGTPAAYTAAGALINITSWDKELQFRMDREYGIANMWLALEFRGIASSSKDLDFTAGYFNAGITVDY